MKLSKTLSFLVLLFLLSGCTLPTNSADSGTSQGSLIGDSSSESSDVSGGDVNSFEDELDALKLGFTATFTYSVGYLSDRDMKTDYLIIEIKSNNEAVTMTITYNAMNPNYAGGMITLFRGEDGNAYVEELTYENAIIDQYEMQENGTSRVPFENTMPNFFSDLSITDLTLMSDGKYATEDEFSANVFSTFVYFIGGYDENSLPPLNELTFEGYFSSDENEIAKYTVITDYASYGMFIELEYEFLSKGSTDIPHMQPLPESYRLSEYESLIEQYQDIYNVSAELSVVNERPEGVVMFLDLNAIIDVYFDGTEILSAKRRDYDNYRYNLWVDYYYYREDEEVDLLSQARLFDEYENYDDEGLPSFITSVYQKNDDYDKQKPYGDMFPKFADISSTFFTKIDDKTFALREGYVSTVASELIPFMYNYSIIDHQVFNNKNAEITVTFGDDGSIIYTMTFEQTDREFDFETETYGEEFTYEETIEVLYYEFETTPTMRLSPEIELYTA